MQKKFTLLIVVFAAFALCCSTANAQQSANAAGGDATGSGGSASYSIGQVVYTAVEGSNGNSNQGVQQPYEFYTTGINDDNKNISLVISAYPNPTESQLYLKVENQGFENLSYQLFDVRGRKVLAAHINSALSVLAMQTLASGSYTLQVLEDENQVKSFNIIKTR